MTTIVADVENGLMASDSRVGHGANSFRSVKLFEVGKELIGVSGNLSNAMKFVDWYAAGCDTDSEPAFEGEGFDALVLDGARLMAWDDSMVPMRVLEPFYAIGSGSQAAMGAMLAGATAEKAIEIAAKLDSNTDSNVVVKTLKSLVKDSDRSSENGWDA
jgi:ATP-dependent protease HslVU (ClpYQ) peptidase subunit